MTPAIHWEVVLQQKCDYIWGTAIFWQNMAHSNTYTCTDTELPLKDTTFWYSYNSALLEAERGLGMATLVCESLPQPLLPPGTWMQLCPHSVFASLLKEYVDLATGYNLLVIYRSLFKKLNNFLLAKLFNLKPDKGRRIPPSLLPLKQFTHIRKRRRPNLEKSNFKLWSSMGYLKFTKKLINGMKIEFLEHSKSGMGRHFYVYAG